MGHLLGTGRPGGYWVVAKISAGILCYRQRDDRLEVFLVHPGGPFWAGKDAGAWSVPKGEVQEGEPAEQAARREFVEETGVPLVGDLRPLPAVRQGRKTVLVWACRSDFDASRIESNLCEIEWPPRSGRRVTFPEVDRGDWCGIAEARRRLLAGQRPLLDSLTRLLEPAGHAPDEPGQGPSPRQRSDDLS
jgi:predicted NUDIX family NTP pyrophosphohydrolase